MVPTIVQLFLTAVVNFNTLYLNSEKSIRALNELINQQLAHKFQRGTCPFPACQQHSLVSAPWVSSAKTKATYLFIPELSSVPTHHQGSAILPVDASSHLISQFWDRDGPAATWEGAGPKKYLVSSCSVKWNWLFIGSSLYGCHQRRLFPPSLFWACQFTPHSYRQPLALINTNRCVTAHARLLRFASIRPFFQQVVSYLRQWLEINTYFYFRLIHFRWVSRRLRTPSLLDKLKS